MLYLPEIVHFPEETPACYSTLSIKLSLESVNRVSCKYFVNRRRFNVIVTNHSDLAGRSAVLERRHADLLPEDPIKIADAAVAAVQGDLQHGFVRLPQEHPCFFDADGIQISGEVLTGRRPEVAGEVLLGEVECLRHGGDGQVGFGVLLDVFQHLFQLLALLTGKLGNSEETLSPEQLRNKLEQQRLDHEFVSRFFLFRSGENAAEQVGDPRPIFLYRLDGEVHGILDEGFQICLCVVAGLEGESVEGKDKSVVDQCSVLGEDAVELLGVDEEEVAGVCLKGLRTDGDFCGALFHLHDLHAVVPVELDLEAGLFGTSGKARHREAWRAVSDLFIQALFFHGESSEKSRNSTRFCGNSVRIRRIFQI